MLYKLIQKKESDLIYGNFGASATLTTQIRRNFPNHDNWKTFQRYIVAANLRDTKAPMSSSCHHLNFRDAFLAFAEVNNRLFFNQGNCFNKHDRHVKYVPQQESPSARSAQGTLPTSTGFMHFSIIIKKADTTTSELEKWFSIPVEATKLVKQNPIPALHQYKLQTLAVSPVFYIPRETCLV
jgi:hypothetical protein